MNQVCNVAVGDQTTLNKLHTLLAEFVAAPARATRGDVRHSRADIGKARALMG